MQNNTPQEIYDAIMEAKSIILCIDSRPDYDAFGSAMALYEVFKQKGKKIRVIYSGTIPPDYKNYISLDVVEQNIDPNQVNFADYDLWISLDSGGLEHISVKENFAPPETLTILNIDHHSTNDFFGKYNYVDTEASSACFILYQLFKEWQIQLSDQVKKYLMLGVLTDTGFFSYANIRAEDFRMVAEMIDSGVDVFQLMYDLNFNESLDEMKFRGVVYSNLRVASDNKYAYTTISLKELKEKNIDMLKVFSRGSDIIKKLKDVKFVFSVRESEEEADLYDVSFRSHEMDYDISVYAKALEGGGHKVAAGGRVIANSMEEALALVIKVIQETN